MGVKNRKQKKSNDGRKLSADVTPFIDENEDVYAKNNGYVSKERYAQIKKEFPFFPECKDIGAERNEAIVRLPSFIDAFALKYIIKDAEDLPMLSMLFNLAFTCFPLEILLYMYPSHVFGIFTVVFNLAIFLGRYVLTLHFTQHKCIFHPAFAWLDYFLPWIIAPFYGMPIGMYRAHHVVMHHIENNIFPFDLSSTEPYQRDNIFHFLHYAAKYWTCIVLLPFYALNKRRYTLAAQTATGSCLFVGMIWYFLFGPGNNRIFGIWALCVPALITGTALMFGNWCQHIFVNPEIANYRSEIKSYRYNCALTYQTMNHPDNQKTWNDGYHVTHHLQSRCPWYNLPVHFLENLEKYRDANAIVFDGLNVFDVGIAVFTGNYKTLTDHYVHLGKEKKSPEEIETFLKSLLVPF